jgi:hypothetical protein
VEEEELVFVSSPRGLGVNATRSQVHSLSAKLPSPATSIGSPHVGLPSRLPK